MPTLATLEDFYRLGLPATALVPPPREVEAVDASLDRLLLKGHGLVEGDAMVFEGQGSLPAPLTTTGRYAAAPVDLHFFQLRHLDGVSAGDIVDLTTTGTKPFAFRVDPRPAYEQALRAASATVQDKATAHSEIVVPTEEVIEVVCVLAAGIVLHANRLRLPLNADQWTQLEKRLGYAHARLKTWEAGKPIAGVTDATPTVPEAGASASLVSGVPVYASGWGWGDGL
jgi:hypothetical protein